MTEPTTAAWERVKELPWLRDIAVFGVEVGDRAVVAADFDAAPGAFEEACRLAETRAAQKRGDAR